MKLDAKRWLGWAAALALFGCNAIIGLDEGIPLGQGGGGPAVCAPDETASCYDGPMGTAGVGICQEGVTTCNQEGAWGPCEGQVLPQQEDCTTDDDEDCDGASPPCPSEVLWQKRFGDADAQDVQAVAASSTGHIALAGSFLGSIDLGGGPMTTAPGVTNGFVAAFAPDGAHRWSRQLPGAPYQLAIHDDGSVLVLVTFSDIFALEPDLIYIAMGSTDLLLIKIRADNEVAWVRQIGGAGADFAGGVSVDGAGRVVVAGRSNGAVDAGCGAMLNAGTDDAFVAQIDPAGGCAWAKMFGTADLQAVFAASASHQGDVLLAGGYYEAIDLGGGALSNLGGADIFVARLSELGMHQWARGFGDVNHQIPSHIAADSGGGAVVAGALTGAIDFGGGPLEAGSVSDFFLVRLDSAGDHLWSRRGGDGGDRSLQGLALDASGAVLLAGAFNGTLDLGGNPLPAASGNDGFIARLGPDGQHRWSKKLGASTLPVHFATVAAGEGGNAVLAGSFEGEIDMGAGPLSSAGQADVFLAVLAP